MPPRDPADLYKDKVEVSLDGRQIFYLFFGGAVIVGLVFVLGVMVGRRVEARGHVDPARTAAAADPLAALDRLEGSGAGLSFKGALTGTPAPTEVERAIGEIEKARKPEKPEKPERVEKKPEKAEKPEPKAGEKKPEPKASELAASGAGGSEKTEKKPEPKASELAASAASEKAEKSEKSEKAHAEKNEKPEKSEKAHAEKGEKNEKSEKSERSKSEKKVAAREDGERKRKKSDGDGEPGAERTRFTLQLSSFQDKQEAEAFVSLLKGAGFQPYMDEAEVSGKGTFYRVRLGSYRSRDAANEAKSEVERVSKKTASVLKL